MDYDRIIEEFYTKYQPQRRKMAPPGARLTLRTEDAGEYESGAIFEGQTVKGNKNYIVFAMVLNGWAYYFHADRAKKVREEDFKSRISYGDIVYVPREKADIEKLALCVLGVNAMTHGLSFNDYMKVYHGYGDGSEVRPA